MTVLFLTFQRVSILCYITAIPIYTPANSVEGFPSLHICTKTLYNTHLNRYEVTSHGFDWHFPDDSYIELLFMYLLASCLLSLDKYLARLLPIFKTM